MEKKLKEVWNVSYYSMTNKLIDQTQIDEKDETLAWELFAEFGHTKQSGDYIDWEEAIED